MKQAQTAGTLNFNIRYGQMTMALVAQAAIHQMRQRLGEPFSQWDASHYNAPHRDRLRQQYEDLPDKLRQEGIEPTKLDFRFR